MHNKKVFAFIVFFVINAIGIYNMNAMIFFSKKFDQNIPPVINVRFDNSISNLIQTNGKSKKINTNTFIETYSIAESTGFLGFTDLVKYKDKWYVTFRISDGHVAKNFGSIVVLESTDLMKWNINQIFKQENYDLRDPKFLVTGNILRIHFHSTNIKPTYGTVRNDFTSKYNNRTGSWSRASRIVKSSDKNSWFWRISYNQKEKSFYTISYINGLKLHKGKNASSFEEIYSFQNTPRGASEGMLYFHNDIVFALIRTSEGSLLMQATNDDMREWQIKKIIPTELAGPNYIVYNDKLIISGRDHKKGTMVLFYYDINTEELSSTVKLPSNAETGYSGMYIENNKLYVSYYNFVISSGAIYHIYLTTIDLPTFIK